MTFQIGQQVVCVEVDFWRNPAWRRKVHLVPQRHMVYTIRDICEENGLIGLYLDEIINPLASFSNGMDEPAFLSTRFRPAIKTSLAVFEKMLASTHREAGRKKLERV
jgi:hypothetical protein